jgi:LysM repeat protein
MPYLATGGAFLFFVFAVVVVVAIHPWSGGSAKPPAAPTPTLPAPTPTPEPSDTPSATPTIAGISASPTINPYATFRIYVVQKGDNLARIAAKFGVTKAAILAANPRVKNANSLRVGLALWIPPPGWVPSTPSPTPALP